MITKKKPSKTCMKQDMKDAAKLLRWKKEQRGRDFTNASPLDESTA